MPTRKGWKIQTPRLQAKCPYCGRKHTVFMTSQANWKIHGVESTLDVSPTPQKPSLFSPADEPETGDGA